MMNDSLDNSSNRTHLTAMVVSNNASHISLPNEPLMVDGANGTVANLDTKHNNSQLFPLSTFTFGGFGLRDIATMVINKWNQQTSTVKPIQNVDLDLLDSVLKAEPRDDNNDDLLYVSNATFLILHNLTKAENVSKIMNVEITNQTTFKPNVVLDSIQTTIQAITTEKPPVPITTITKPNLWKYSEPTRKPEFVQTSKPNDWLDENDDNASVDGFFIPELNNNTDVTTSMPIMNRLPVVSNQYFDLYALNQTTNRTLSNESSEEFLLSLPEEPLPPVTHKPEVDTKTTVTTLVGNEFSDSYQTNFDNKNIENEFTLLSMTPGGASGSDGGFGNRIPKKLLLSGSNKQSFSHYNSLSIPDKVKPEKEEDEEEEKKKNNDDDGDGGDAVDADNDDNDGLYLVSVMNRTKIDDRYNYIDVGSGLL